MILAIYSSNNIGESIMCQQLISIDQSKANYLVSEHAQVRLQQRGISQQNLIAVLRYGRCVHARGANIHVIGKKEIRRYEREGIDLDGMNGLHVVCNVQDKVIMTAYKNHCLKGLRDKKTLCKRH